MLTKKTGCRDRMEIDYLMGEPGQEKTHFLERCREYYNRLRYRPGKEALPLAGHPVRCGPELEIVCYCLPGWVLSLPDEKALPIMREAVLARQFAQGGLWYEGGLAQRFGLMQPEPGPELLLLLLREMLGDRQPEALVMLEREDGDWREQSERCAAIIGAVYGSLNHLTVVTKHPEAYAELTERLYEDSGLVLRCLENPAPGYPYGPEAVVMDFRGKRKGKRGYFPRDAVWLDICAQTPKFLDTAVKNGYNNNS